MSQRNLADGVRTENCSTSSELTSRPSCSRRSSALNNECMTAVKSVILTQRWTVGNFESLLKLSQPGVCLRSTVFKDDAIPDACWQLCLYPGGKREENANNVSLFLKMSATSPAKEVILKAEYRFYFLDDNDDAKFSNVNIGEFHAKPPKGGHSWGLRNIPTQKVQNSIRSDKSLVISCQIELIPDVTKVPCRKVPLAPVIQVPSAEIPTSFVEAELAMLTSGDDADLDVIAGEEYIETFRVHSYKLKAHSDVFRAMLESNMIESSQRLIRISDFAPKVVKAMLQFVYAGVIHLDLTVDEAVLTMQIADKYAIMALKTTCEQYLLDRLVIDNVLDCIVNADMIKSTTLLEACSDFIVLNRQKVMNLPEWRMFCEKHSNISTSVLERIIHINDVPPPVKKSRH